MNELQSAANKELTTKGTLSEVLKLVRSFVLSVVILSKAFDLLKYTSLTPKKTLSEILQLVKKKLLWISVVYQNHKSLCINSVPVKKLLILVSVFNFSIM